MESGGFELTPASRAERQRFRGTAGLLLRIASRGTVGSSCAWLTNSGAALWDSRRRLRGVRADPRDRLGRDSRSAAARQQRHLQRHRFLGQLCPIVHSGRKRRARSGRFVPLRSSHAIAEILIGELPALHRIEQPVAEAAHLLVWRDVQEQLDEANSGVDEHAVRSR